MTYGESGNSGCRCGDDTSRTTGPEGSWVSIGTTSDQRHPPRLRSKVNEGQTG